MKLTLLALASVVALSIAPLASAGQSETGTVELGEKTISIDGVGFRRTIPCNGRKLEVAGSGHVITTTGECSNVEVSGTGNTVDFAIAPKGTFEVSGATQTIRWKSSGDVKQSISGVGHKITRVK